VPDAHGTVLNHVFAPLGSFNSWSSSPAALLPSVCYATKLADNRKKLQIKNPQKKR
jgi:hypothetical protein